jgi:hypothetical protein
MVQVPFFGAFQFGQIIFDLHLFDTLHIIVNRIDLTTFRKTEPAT